MYKVIFENEHFVIVDKGPEVLSVPGRQGMDDERPVLGRELEKDFQIKIYPVHRLDYEVQGLIAYAKTPEAHKAANAWFEKKEVHKTYMAITSPLENAASFPINEQLEWKSKLLRGKKRAYESPQGKSSLTLAKLIEKKGSFFYWHLNPVTGRSHQLRYELYRHGHPIVGDELYSSDKTFAGPGIALRAFKIDFSKAPKYENFGLPPEIEISALT